MSSEKAEDQAFKDRREKKLPPIPVNYLEYLNDDQRAALRQIESYGWTLKFIRRPLFQIPTIVVINADGTQYGVLEDDGRMNLDHDLIIRD